MSKRKHTDSDEDDAGIEGGHGEATMTGLDLNGVDVDDVPNYRRQRKSRRRFTPEEAKERAKARQREITESERRKKEATMAKYSDNCQRLYRVVSAGMATNGFGAGTPARQLWVRLDRYKTPVATINSTIDKLLQNSPHERPTPEQPDRSDYGLATVVSIGANLRHRLESYRKSNRPDSKYCLQLQQRSVQLDLGSEYDKPVTLHPPQYHNTNHAYVDTMDRHLCTPLTREHAARCINWHGLADPHTIVTILFRNQDRHNQRLALFVSERLDRHVPGLLYDLWLIICDYCLLRDENDYHVPGSFSNSNRLEQEDSDCCYRRSNDSTADAWRQRFMDELERQQARERREREERKKSKELKEQERREASSVRVIPVVNGLDYDCPPGSRFAPALHSLILGNSGFDHDGGGDAVVQRDQGLGRQAKQRSVAQQAHVRNLSLDDILSGMTKTDTPVPVRYD